MFFLSYMNKTWSCSQKKIVQSIINLVELNKIDNTLLMSSWAISPLWYFLHEQAVKPQRCGVSEISHNNPFKYLGASYRIRRCNHHSFVSSICPLHLFSEYSFSFLLQCLWLRGFTAGSHTEERTHFVERIYSCLLHIKNFDSKKMKLLCSLVVVINFRLRMQLSALSRGCILPLLCTSQGWKIRKYNYVIGSLEGKV